MAFLVGLVMIGGVKWIASVCKVLVPFMALIYVVGCILLLVYNIDYAWDAIKLIITSAFTPKSVAGGFAGGGIMLSMRYGFARGLFSNESGMGSAPIIASAAKTKNAVR
jgi:AGCS family alanine or glycine:cation symporter